jgi:hypothetical protein
MSMLNNQVVKCGKPRIFQPSCLGEQFLDHPQAWKIIETLSLSVSLAIDR